MRVYVRMALLLAVVGALLIGSTETDAAPGTTQRVSVDSAGDEGNGESESPAISADGRYVAFDSFASNLVLQDTNGRDDVFVHNRQTGVTQRVSLSSAGAQGNSDSAHPALGGDGRYVAFDSNATNLVLNDTNVRVDVFVRDRDTDTTERASLSSAGAQGNDTSWYPAISADGRYVAFRSFASNLVSGDTYLCTPPVGPQYNCEDIFVRDRQAGTTVRVSVSSAGAQANNGSWDSAISGDGRYVAFASDASNLVAGDTNSVGDIFVHDRDTDQDGIFDEAGAISTTRVSVDSAGAQSDGDSYYAAINADGRYVAFASAATNLLSGAGDTNGHFDVFVRDRQTSTTIRVSVDSAGTESNGDSFYPAISSNGISVAFRSAATNLVYGDTNAVEDIFLHGLQTGATERVSTAGGGAQGDGASTAPAVSGSGRYVAFESEATNLVPDDTNDVADVFVRDRLEAVGGIAELPEAARDSGSPDIDPALLAGAAAVALALLTAGAWHVGRRFRQS